ncbi:SH3 domain-containing protein [Pectobacterium parmentieri]|uniref:hypothetical protein n=1 Tax=Pectobacterium parmentieri TaxID=1905730 RepID=UPI0001B1003A|nr:hypothetical protein [Pectobacterium parmentieri]ACX88229.1 conserved hypothetical protein [Pectobacterium parmentieri WPP163]AYH01661.1 hypothetical protein C5E26_12330 [Pectobacterium parmentieri]AYH27928.1 hypothetical protein C5E20_12735 [Pectobacterium parmentieri]AYH32234.1 hypothetical protein C5E19_11765 [Pectobacterium parmentieri]MBI0516998.1 SH3 domain-containing protein [Pectobacterium parmentieri]
MERHMKRMVNHRIVLSLMFVFAVAGCEAPPKMTDDTIVNSTVDGVTLSHRYAVKPPAQFSPINEAYRALYPASIMTRSDFGGNVVNSLKSGETYTVIGQVENNWLALGEQVQVAVRPEADTAKTDDKKVAEQPTTQLIGYVPFRAVVKSELYDQTIKADQPKRRTGGKKKTCVSVDSDSKACRNTTSGTWIIN